MLLENKGGEVGLVLSSSPRLAVGDSHAEALGPDSGADCVFAFKFESLQHLGLGGLIVVERNEKSEGLALTRRRSVGRQEGGGVWD